MKKIKKFDQFLTEGFYTKKIQRKLGLGKNLTYKKGDHVRLADGRTGTIFTINDFEDINRIGWGDGDYIITPDPEFRTTTGDQPDIWNCDEDEIVEII